MRREWIVRPNPAEIEKAKDGNRTTDLGIQEASVTLVVRAVSSLDGKWGGEARRKVMGVTEQRHRLLALVTLLPHHACLLLQGALDRSPGVLVSPELSAAPMTVGKVLPSLAMCLLPSIHRSPRSHPVFTHHSSGGGGSGWRCADGWLVG